MRKLIIGIGLIGILGIIFDLYKIITAEINLAFCCGLGCSVILAISAIALYLLVEIRDELRDINANKK